MLCIPSTTRWRNGSNVSYRPRCPRDAAANPTAVTRAVEGPASPGVRWLLRHDADLPGAPRARTGRLPLPRVPAVRRRTLRGNARTRISRRESARSAPGVVGDLRYDRSPGLDFSDLPLDRAAPCPKRVPPWTPPRSDLFGPLE